ncbi:MAG: transglutaminase family protein [Acidimicrobiales bacterium]
MSWRVAVRHVSGYRYGSDVHASYNEARMTPLTTARQTVLDADLSVEPAATLFRYTDFWATLVHAFDIHEPHRALSVSSTSVVETGTAEGASEEASWDELRGDPLRDRFAELLTPTHYVPLDETVGGPAGDMLVEMAGERSPAAAVALASEWVQERLSYVPGATQVSTSASEAFASGKGVCQDFAHLTLALLRMSGIPCRYVSGYLHPRDDARIGEPVAGASHAWVEAWTGDWWALDPTNGRPVGERHVTVARGRDYADVSPLRGVYQGGPAEELEVVVEVTRLA